MSKKSLSLVDDWQLIELTIVDYLYIVVHTIDFYLLIIILSFMKLHNQLL